MKRIALYFGAAVALVASCSVQEEDFKTPQQDDVIYYASFEQPADEGTRVFANDDLLLRWTADDRVSIFGKNTYNQQYKFLGETGDNSGGFSKVDGAEYVTGNPISHTVSVYPYQTSTKITEDEVLTITLPAEQHYAENTFGIGANAMVSVSADNILQFKNVGGYLRISLYGQGVSVSSVKLKGNNGEKLAGKATVTMPLDGEPTAVMANDATTEITLTCESPVQLGTSAEESTQFWFVVPPVSFSKGFEITVFGRDGVFEKKMEKTVDIKRNHLSKMTPIEVDLSQPSNTIYYTSVDGNVVTPYMPDAFGVEIVSNEYSGGVGVITFDGNLIRVGDEAFGICTNLASISIPDSVTSIGEYAFAGCKSLSSISIPKGVTRIGRKAFVNCPSLTGISIPDSVTSIGDYAFEECTGLTNITLPNGVGSIGESVFRGCTSLSSINIPDSVTSIGEWAFWRCTSLSSINIPDSVTSIGGGAFYDCSSLSSISIPDSVTSIGGWAFQSCNGLSNATLPVGLTVIEPGLFSYCSSLISINIPDTVTSIGGSAFSGCSSLADITIPENVTEIGWSVFSDCANLTSIYIPDKVTSIGEGVFGGCSSLVSFRGKYASADGLFLIDSGLLIAVAVRRIGQVITIPNGITRIGNAAFRGSQTLTSITIPDSVTSIGASVFAECPCLSSITLPEGLTSIEFGLFKNCSNLISVNIPDSVTSIGESAFWNCSSLTSITIPEGVTKLEYQSFCNCSSINEISIPDSVSSIGMRAFQGCSSLTNVTIPKGVTSIDMQAFYDCSSLTSITVLPATPPKGNFSMFDNTNNCPIYVPSGYVDEYKAASWWIDYSDRIQAITE